MGQMHIKIVNLILTQAGVLFDIYISLDKRIEKGDITKKELGAHLMNIQKIAQALHDLYQDDDFQEVLKTMPIEDAENMVEIGKIFTEIFHGLREEHQEMKTKRKPLNDLDNMSINDAKKLRSMMPWEIKTIVE